jgi:uncharacterized phage infection (PIP) family protein YhgE
MTTPTGYTPAFGTVRDAVAAELASQGAQITAATQAIADLARTAADTAQALVNFRATLAEAVAAFAVGTYFTCAETGTLRVYKRINAAPGYADQGDAAAPVSKGNISAP